MSTTTRPAKKSPAAKRPATKSPATKNLATKNPTKNRPAASSVAKNRPTAARDQAAADRRLAALADELAHRDSAAYAERESRRPTIWLLAMTLGAVALAQLAVYVMVAPPV